jgi:hypothetical protein
MMKDMLLIGVVVAFGLHLISLRTWPNIVVGSVMVFCGMLTLMSELPPYQKGLVSAGFVVVIGLHLISVRTPSR